MVLLIVSVFRFCARRAQNRNTKEDKAPLCRRQNRRPRKCCHLHIKENKIMKIPQIQQLISSRVLRRIALLIGIALTATPALRTVAAAPIEPRTWQVGVGIETEDHRI